jgi:REP-associated tyrosine transposase
MGGKMTRSYTKIYIHYIWATKNRQRILTKQVREKVVKHIREYAKANDIVVEELGGYLDHLHLLIDSPPTKSPSEVINLIKGESSHWINEMILFVENFLGRSDIVLFLSVLLKKIRLGITFEDRKSIIRN